jgi:hypothetical protein
MTPDWWVKDRDTDIVLQSQFQLTFTVMTIACRMMMGSAASGD